MIDERQKRTGTRRRGPLTQSRVAFEKSLSAYATAATAAGVSLLALAPAAEAKIVYTPANTPIPVDGGWVPLDLNHDGIADFSFYNLQTESGGVAGTQLVARRNGSDAIWGRGFFYLPMASALRVGFTVGTNKSHFQQGSKIWGMWSRTHRGSGYFYASRTWGQWLYAQGRYLGLRFMISGGVHYGWARFDVTWVSRKGIEATLTGYAYETIPNKPIIAGKTKGPDVVILEPASLGRLAQGASAIPAWRAKPAP